MTGVGRSLVILDGADTIDDADNASYIDLEYFLPDAPSVDVIITTRSSRAQEITVLEAVEVADMEPAEAAEFVSHQRQVGPDLVRSREHPLDCQRVGIPRARGNADGGRMSPPHHVYHPISVNICPNTVIDGNSY
jgi:hypothetical protein